jgi:predicted RNA-binding protein
MSRIIPKDERSSEPLDTENIIHHPDMVRANEWIVSDYEIPVRPICIFVPCSKKKPYHTSPSHQKFDEIIFSLLTPADVHIVTFGTCGVVPRELDSEYPFMNYSFMMGQCNIAKVKRDFLKTETKRLAEYLTKTKDTYKCRIAYCIGDFREAMIQAAEQTQIPILIVPKSETIEHNIQPNKKFIFNSLSCSDYLADFAAAITDAMKQAGLSHPNNISVQGAEEDTNDTEWYDL